MSFANSSRVKQPQADLYDDPKWLANDYEKYFRSINNGSISPVAAAQNAIKLEALKSFYLGFYDDDEGQELIASAKKKAADQIENKKLKFKGNEDKFYKTYANAMLSDPYLKPYRDEMAGLFASHVRSDFPLWFRHCREFRVVNAERSCPSQWRRYTRTRTVDNCKKISPLDFTVDSGLEKQCESEDLEYTTIKENEQKSYGVGKYRKGYRWSWEMTQCDSIDGLRQITREFGLEAGETPKKVVFQAMADGVSATPLITNVPPGPITYPKLQEIWQTVICKGDVCCNLDTIIHGNSEALNVTTLLRREFMDFQGGEPNPFTGLTQIHEPDLDQFLGGDYLLVDSRKRWLELSTMREFAGGPLLLFKDTDVRGTDRWGSFDNMTFDIQGLWIGGAGVVKDDCVIRVEGCGGCA